MRYGQVFVGITCPFFSSESAYMPDLTAHGVRIGARSETKQVIALVTGGKAFITYEPKSLPGGVEDSKSKEELRGRKQELIHTESSNNSCGKDIDPALKFPSLKTVEL